MIYILLYALILYLSLSATERESKRGGSLRYIFKLCDYIYSLLRHYALKKQSSEGSEEIGKKKKMSTCVCICMCVRKELVKKIYIYTMRISQI